jgi:hypothetical protein
MIRTIAQAVCAGRDARIVPNSNKLARAVPFTFFQQPCRGLGLKRRRARRSLLLWLIAEHGLALPDEFSNGLPTLIF